jgi:hypothetical protein
MTGAPHPKRREDRRASGRVRRPDAHTSQGRGTRFDGMAEMPDWPSQIVRQGRALVARNRGCGMTYTWGTLRVMDLTWQLALGAGDARRRQLAIIFEATFYDVVRPGHRAAEGDWCLTVRSGIFDAVRHSKCRNGTIWHTSHVVPVTAAECRTVSAHAGEPSGRIGTRRTQADGTTPSGPWRTQTDSDQAGYWRRGRDY